MSKKIRPVRERVLRIRAAADARASFIQAQSSVGVAKTPKKSK